GFLRINMNRVAIPAVFLLAVLTAARTKPAPAPSQGSAGQGARPPAAAGSTAVNKEFLAAMDALREGRLAAAEPVLTKLLKAAPENADYNLGMGTLLAMKGDTHSAVPLLEKSIKL